MSSKPADRNSEYQNTGYKNSGYQDTKLDTKIILSGMWMATLILFAYVDIFSFWRADVIEGSLAGELPDVGISINQTFLAAGVGFIVIPTLMIVASLVLKSSINRLLNIIVGTLYAIVVAVLCIGESWYYYLIGSFFEVVLLLAIARTAWKWPTATASATA